MVGLYMPNLHIPYTMESFEVTVRQESYKIIHDSSNSKLFSVFNHATFHIIEKSNSGKWTTVKHRFGKEMLPVSEIGAAIEMYNQNLAWKNEENKSA